MARQWSAWWGAVCWLVLGACGDDQTAIVLEAEQGTVSPGALDEVVFQVRRTDDRTDPGRAAIAPLVGPEAKAFPLQLVLVGQPDSRASFQVAIEGRKAGAVTATAVPAGAWTEIAFTPEQVVRYRFSLRPMPARAQGYPLGSAPVPPAPPPPAPQGLPTADAGAPPDADASPASSPEAGAPLAAPDAGPAPGPMADAGTPPATRPDAGSPPAPVPDAAPAPPAPPGPGQACGPGVACRAGLACTGGRCCHSPCDGACQAGTCGANGRCLPRPDGTRCHGSSGMRCQDGVCARRGDDDD